MTEVQKQEHSGVVAGVASLSEDIFNEAWRQMAVVIESFFREYEKEVRETL